MKDTCDVLENKLIKEKVLTEITVISFIVFKNLSNSQS